jgi:hypothetical protein
VIKLVDVKDLNARLHPQSPYSAALNKPAPEYEKVPEGVDYFDEPNGQDEAPPATLERLTALAAEARDLEDQINADTVALEELKGKHDKITKRFIPTIMEELALEKFTMSDGAEISIKESIAASISAENKPAAFAWLAERNFDGIIKTKVQSEFGKGEIEKARELVARINEAGFDASLDQNVHPMTLKSFVKERLEAGDSIPLDVFGVFESKEAKIKLPKRKK